MVYQNHKSRSFQVRGGVRQGSDLGAVFFSLFINDLPVFLPSLAAELSFLLSFYQAIMGPQTFVFPGERRG